MSDRDLRRILNEIIEDFDTGRLRMIRRHLPTVRNVVGSAMIAATLGLGGVACDTQSVGTTTDAGIQRDAAAEIDGGGGDLLYMAPIVDAGPMPEYAEPFYDAGGVFEYMAPPIDAGDMPAYMAPPWDAGVEPVEDAGNMEAYGVPPVPPQE